VGIYRYSSLGWWLFPLY